MLEIGEFFYIFFTQVHTFTKICVFWRL